MVALRSIDAVAAFKALGFDIELVSAERVVLLRQGRRVVVPRHKDLIPHDVDLLLSTAQVTRDEFNLAMTRRPSSGIHSKVVIVPPKSGEGE